MKSPGILKSGALGIVIFFSLSGASRMFAQFQERQRLFDIYVGFNANYDLPYHSEVFNGEYLVATDEEVIILPKLDPNYGFNLVTGLRSRNITSGSLLTDFRPNSGCIVPRTTIRIRSWILRGLHV